MYSSNFDKLLEKIKDSSKAILEASEKKLNNKEFALQATYANGYVYKYLPSHFQHDKDFIYAVLDSAEDISIIDPIYFSDYEICLKFCLKNLVNLSYINNDLQCNHQFILNLVKKHATAILFIPSHVLNDSELAFKIIKTNPSSYCYLPEVEKERQLHIDYILENNFENVLPYIPAEQFKNVYELSDFISLLERNQHIEKNFRKTSQIKLLINNLLRNSIFTSFMSVKYFKEIKNFTEKQLEQHFENIDENLIYLFLLDKDNIYYVYELIYHLEETILKLERNTLINKSDVKKF